MPPKRQNQDDGRDSDPLYSATLPTKKVNTGAAPPRRSTRAKSDSELPSYNENENENENENGNENENENANSPAANDDSSDLSSIPASESDQTGERVGDKLWEILDNDQRTPLQIGVEAPTRLKLRFRNRDTKTIREYDYKKDDAEAMQKIDWSDKNQIAGIMRWRSQIFNRLGFPIRGTTRWSKNEVAFLTLVFEKLALAAEQTKRLALPASDVIFQLFTDEFGSGRERSAFDTRVRRKDNSRLAEVKGRLEDEGRNLKPQDGPEYQLTVVQGELEAYLEHGYVRLAFDLAEYQLFAGTGPATKTAAKARKVVRQKTTKTAESKPKTPTGKSAPDSPILDAPSNNDDKVKFLLVVYPESNIRSVPVETTADTYNALVARNQWLSTVMGPSAASETITRPLRSSNAAQQSNVRTVERENQQDWMSQATIGLHKRIDRLKGDLALDRASRNALRADWHADRDNDTDHRTKGAAAVNALLNTAIVPPVGYRGDVRALVENGALPDDQVLLLQRHEAALRIYHDAHDREYGEKF